jgi:hypothetical protein
MVIIIIMSKAQSTSSWSMYGWAHRPKATHLTQCLYVVLQLGNILLLDRCFHSSPNVSSFIILALFYYYYYHHFYFYTVCNDQIYLFRLHFDTCICTSYTCWLLSICALVKYICNTTTSIHPSVRPSLHPSIPYNFFSE